MTCRFTTGRKNKDNKYPIVLFLRNGNQQKQITTNIFVDSNILEYKKGIPTVKTRYAGDSQINDYLRRIYFEIQQVISTKSYNHLENFVEKVKLILKGKEHDDGDGVKIEDALKKFLDGYGEHQKNSKKSFQSKFNKFLEFCELKKVTYLSDIDYLLLEQYKNQMLGSEKYSNTTIRRYIKCVKQLLRWFDFNTKIKIDERLLKYKDNLSSVDNDPISLTEEELSYLEGYQFSNNKDEKVIDHFLFQLYTGQRISDIIKISNNEIVDNIWIFTQQKTGNQIEINFNSIPKLLKIYNKYKNFGKPIPQINPNTINKKLKEIFKELNLDRLIKKKRTIGKKDFSENKKLYELISTHVARQTFVTLSIRKGMPVLDIMYITGHKDIDSMKPYIAMLDEEAIKNYEKYWG